MDFGYIIYIIFGIVILMVILILSDIWGGKVLPIFLGCVMTFLGLKIIIQPGFYDRLYSFYFDFTGYNIAFGLFMVVVGVGFVWTGFRKKRGKGNDSHL